ncbi:MAG: carboxypeptidase-like regulatory domain-containing protein [Thermoanaerobaculia bacterium]
MRGLSAGSLALLAADGQGRQSERSVLELVEGRWVGPVELRLRSMKKLSGSVLSSRGPVAGARVVLRAFSPTVGGGEASTGPEGTFTLEVPENIGAATAVVKAPGYGTKAFLVAAGEKPLSLTLAEAAGEIAIVLPRSAADLSRENLRVILFQDDMEVPVNLLRTGEGPQVVSNAEPVLRLASLAPGRYSACLAQRQVESKGAALDAAAKDASFTCDTGQLAAGGTLALTLRER